MLTQHPTIVVDSFRLQSVSFLADLAGILRLADLVLEDFFETPVKRFIDITTVIGQGTAYVVEHLRLGELPDDQTRLGVVAKTLMTTEGAIALIVSREGSVVSEIPTERRRSLIQSIHVSQRGLVQVRYRPFQRDLHYQVSWRGDLQFLNLDSIRHHQVF